jgi:hypothetical protein
MHRIQARTYVGQPGEAGTLATQTAAGGQVAVTLDGRPISANGSFPLPATAGSQSTLQIALAGPIGASCVVAISTVDGGMDGDFLMCQPLLPAPVHLYTFMAATAQAVTAFAAVKASRDATPARARVRRGRGGK